MGNRNRGLGCSYLQLRTRDSLPHRRRRAALDNRAYLRHQSMMRFHLDLTQHRRTTDKQDDDRRLIIVSNS